MTGDLRQQPRRAGRIAFLKLAVIAVIAGAALMSACSQPSDSQQTAAQQQQQAADEQTRKEADEKAWADAEKAGTAAAYTAYIQNFGGGAHAAEARQRVAELSRKEADDKAWADAVRAGTVAAFTVYIQNFSTGAHVAEARQRAAALETQGRREVPGIDIQKTCQAAAGAMVSLMGGTTTEQDVNACLDSEQKARDQIFKDRATYAAADKKQCMRTDVYLPSYVEWLTCLVEMERDVRKMHGEDQFGAAMLPKVSPAINPAATRQSQRGREPASSRRKGSRLEIY